MVRLSIEHDDAGSPRVRGLVPGETYLLLSTVAHGVGASGLGLDRGQPGDVRVVEVRRAGRRVLLVARDKHHGASGPDEAGRAAGRDAFVESVLWSGTLPSGPPGSGGDRADDQAHDHADDLPVDAEALATLDLVGAARRLRDANQGDLRLDAARSALVAADATPDGVELTAVLTFAGGVTGAQLAEVAPDPGAVTITQRVSLLRAPDGFRPRPFHPAAGGYGKGSADHAAGIGESVEVLRQPRFRVGGEHDGGAAPITFQVDAGIPEPVRSAVVEGASWWAEGFDRAGLPGAYAVRVADADVDPFAARTSFVWWVHRTGRGWSQGAAITDPRTGEILRGQVRLGSQRVHQLTLLAEALLAPYGRPDEAERLARVEAFVLARIRQLAAHEVGHALGFMHNYASHRHAHPSVMDYPHPRVRLDGDGEVDLSDAYPVGLGPWDVFAVRHAYGAGDADELARLRAEVAATLAPDGPAYLTDADGHDPHAASPDAVPWVQRGQDPLALLGEALDVRRAALAAFGPGVAPPGLQAGALEERFVPLHLFHRYETTAVARLLGGERYGYALAGEDPRVDVVPAARQRAALDALLTLLDDDVLAVPEHVVRLLVPPAIRSTRGPGHLAPRRGLLFDPAQASGVAASLVAGALLDPARLNRLAWQHDADPAVPAPAEVVERTLRVAWSSDGPPSATRSAAGWAAVQHVARTLREGGLHPWTAAEVADAARRAGAEQSARGPQGAAAARALAEPHGVEAPPGLPLGVPL